MGARPHQTMASKTLPKHEANEFGGAGGCIGVMLGLPFGIWALYVVCNDKFVLPLPFGPPAWFCQILRHTRSTATKLWRSLWDGIYSLRCCGQSCLLAGSMVLCCLMELSSSTK